MTSVWVVTKGEYSDYRVLLAFTTKALADAFAERHNARRRETYFDAVRVEEFPLLDSLPAASRITYRAQAHVEDGVVSAEREWSEERPVWEPLPQDHVYASRDLRRIVTEGDSSTFTVTPEGKPIIIAPATPTVYAKYTMVNAEGSDPDRVRALLRAKVEELLRTS